MDNRTFLKRAAVTVSYIDLGYSQSWNEENGQRDIPTSDNFNWSSDFTPFLALGSEFLLQPLEIHLDSEIKVI